MSRRLAAVAAVAVTAGAGVMLAALVADPGPWWRGYVSEAGAAGHPYAIIYRLGLVLLAIGVALLGRAQPRIGLLLLVAAGLAGTSGVVPCSDGCPLPPFEPTTLTDVVHTAASILGMFVLAAAMAARPAPRSLSTVALALTVPLGAALGLMMLFAGRGATSAILERVLLVVAVSWLVGIALATVFDPAPESDRRVEPAVRR
ncbi:DUF998 domain-containing protein [Actinoplanes sp. HUAS TT8]|uniref:DUF998 domain-containing protein n=1 Tax=Actinoplanes sp. HUAS TT8 TaxID=3447453 RepID=UPI003F520595